MAAARCKRRPAPCPLSACCLLLLPSAASFRAAGTCIRYESIPVRAVVPTAVAPSDAELELMVKTEIDRAFDGLEAGELGIDEAAALELIESKAAVVLQNVLQQLY